MTDNKVIRKFDTGATRDTADNKPDYEGFLSSSVLLEYGQYMLSHQKQSDGSMRDSDNWQKGIPITAYIKSLFRHFVDLWRLHRGFTVVDQKTKLPVTVEQACCAILFNVSGYLHEFIKRRDDCKVPPRLDGGANSGTAVMLHDGFYPMGGKLAGQTGAVGCSCPVGACGVAGEDGIPG